jgi:hypothetical protein
MEASMSLNMENIDDDGIEELFVFIRGIATLDLYGSELDPPGVNNTDPNDAVECLNNLIRDARELLG